MLQFFPKPFLLISACCCILACSKSGQQDNLQDSLFKEPVSVQLANDFPDEVSGIADSYSCPGSLWMIEDGLTSTDLLRMKHTGELQAPVKLPQLINRDWEELAIGPGPEAGKNYLYIGEIGDNDAKYNEYAFYRMPEPEETTQEITSFDKIRFAYEGGASHNAVAFFVEPSTKDLYILTKEVPSAIYILRYPYPTDQLNTAEKLGNTQLEIVTGAAIGKDGTEILARTYLGVYYWKKNAGESIGETLKKKPLTIPSVLEPQGEAITFKNDLKGFYTLSERATGIQVPLRLYYYQRN